MLHLSRLQPHQKTWKLFWRKIPISVPVLKTIPAVALHNMNCWVNVICVWTSLCQRRWRSDTSHQPREQDQDPAYAFVTAAESLSKHHVVASWWSVVILVICCWWDAVGVFVYSLELSVVCTVALLLFSWYIFRHLVSSWMWSFFTQQCPANLIISSVHPSLWRARTAFSTTLFSVSFLQFIT